MPPAARRQARPGTAAPGANRKHPWITIIVLIVGLSVITYGLVRFGYGPRPGARSHLRTTADKGHSPKPPPPMFRLPAKSVGMAVNPPALGDLKVLTADLGGSKPSVVETYLKFGGTLPFDQIKSLDEQKVLPFIQLNPRHINLHFIATGKYDTWLTQLADNVKKLPGPVWLSFAHEMNGEWYTWSIRDPIGEPQTVKNRPLFFRAAWRHIWKLFQAQHVTNAKWVWTISRDPQQPGWPPLRVWWPGAKYVDRVGMNGYYRYGNAAQSFDTLYKPQLSIVRTITKDPVMITETGVGPGPDQAREIRNLFAGVARTDGVLGFIWFDVNVDEHWNIDGNTAAAAAIKAGMSHYHVR